MFDFEILKREIIKAFMLIRKEGNCGMWELKDYIAVFVYFCEKYRKRFNRDPGRMTQETVNSIVRNLPFTDGLVRSGGVDLSPEDYKSLIDAYFVQEFTDCDYSMSHFMSGDIRTLRYYETLY